MQGSIGDLQSIVATDRFSLRPLRTSSAIFAVKGFFHAEYAETSRRTCGGRRSAGLEMNPYTRFSAFLMVPFSC